MFQGLVPSAVAASVRRPVAVIIAALLLCLGAGWFAASHFDMTTDTAELIAPGVDWRRDEARIDAAFPQNRDLTVVVIDGATPEAAERAAATLSARLVRDKAHFRSVRRPDAGEFFARNGLLFGTPAEVADTTAQLIAAQPFLGPLAADPSVRGVMTSLSTVLTGVDNGSAKLGDIAKPIAALDDGLGKVAAGKPAQFSWIALFGTGKGALAAPKRRIVLVQPVLDYSALMPGEAASDAIRHAATGLGATIRLTGEVPLADEEFASLADGAWIVGLVMIGSMLLILWLATRSARIVAAITLTTVAGLVVTAALGLALVGRFNLISVAFIPLFVGLGIDFGIQLSVRFRAEQGAAADVGEALRRAGHGLGGSLLVAASAVALGFVAFLPTDYIGVSELGIIASVGMIVALGLSVTLMPALLAVLRPGQAGDTGLTGLTAADGWLTRHRKAVLWAFAAWMAVSIALLPWVQFDFNPYHLRNPNGEAMRTLADLMRDPDRTPNTLNILAANEAEAGRLATRLARLPQVAQAVTVADFVPAEQPGKLAAIADARDLLDLTLNPFDVAPAPTDAETIAALTRTAAQLRSVASNDAPAIRLAGTLEALARGPVERRTAATALLVPPLEVLLGQTRELLLAAPVSRATLPADLVRDWITPSGAARVQVFPSGDSNDNATLARFTAAVQAVAPHASGPPVSIQAAAGTIGRAFVEAGVYALIAIGGLLFLVLRSVREVAFTLAPVVLSGFLTLATCVVIGQPINFANIIAFPLLFGVGVAFHIYFVMAWRGGATGLLHSSLARAVLFSALATGAAFGSLWLSNHPGTASMGKILMISLAWTLVCALVFEPALLGSQKRKS
ncbi:MMPL family transporter [Glacieibacterium sp.]|uniref:MMPL family transporter n=1 Tax=Glacieibacterium sp. TaxID=2860237 RepID=UPI003B0081EA